MIGLGCLWLSSLLEMFHLAIYSHNGIGDPLAHAIAQCLRVGAQVSSLIQPMNRQARGGMDLHLTPNGVLFFH